MTGVDMSAIGAARRPFCLRCDVCEHVRPAGDLPMPAVLWANLLRKSTCSRCGAGAPHLKPVAWEEGRLVEIKVASR